MSAATTAALASQEPLYLHIVSGTRVWAAGRNGDGGRAVGRTGFICSRKFGELITATSRGAIGEDRKYSA